MHPGVGGRRRDYLPLGLLRLKKPVFSVVFPHVPVEVQERHAVLVLGNPLPRQRLHQFRPPFSPRQLRTLPPHGFHFGGSIQSHDAPQVLWLILLQMLRPLDPQQRTEKQGYHDRPQSIKRRRQRAIYLVERFHQAVPLQQRHGQQHSRMWQDFRIGKQRHGVFQQSQAATGPIEAAVQGIVIERERGCRHRCCRLLDCRHNFRGRLVAPDNPNPTMLENVADIKMINTPTEVDHYQLFRVIDVYVSPKGEDLGGLSSEVGRIIKQTKLPPNIRVEMRGSVVSMHQSFFSFGIGLLLAIVLVYLVLMAQFASFIDPFIILLAIPSGVTGVIVFLLITHTTLNVMSLMGLIMMTGIVVSNSILIVDVTRSYRRGGMPIREAVALACRVRLRPILMTSLATILGLIPMALALEAGSEQYAPLARAIIGGLTVSVVVTVFLVPAAYLVIHRKEEQEPRQEVQA